MPPLKPQNGVKKRVVVTVFSPSKKRPPSFFEEYYYGALAVEFVFISILVGAAGMGFAQGTLVGLLVTSITAVAWQFRQYSKFKNEPTSKPKSAAAKESKVAKEKWPNPDFTPIRPAKRPPVPVGPDGKKKFPPSYFPPLRDRKPQQ